MIQKSETFHIQKNELLFYKIRIKDRKLINMHDYSVEKNKKIYNMSVNSLFEDRVKEHPNKAAIVYKNQTYTFFDLNCCANQYSTKINCCYYD